MIGWKEDFGWWIWQRCTEIKIQSKSPVLTPRPGTSDSSIQLPIRRIYVTDISNLTCQSPSLLPQNLCLRKPTPSQLMATPYFEKFRSKDYGSCLNHLVIYSPPIFSISKYIWKTTNLDHLHHYHFGPHHYFLPGLWFPYFRPWLSHSSMQQPQLSTCFCQFMFLICSQSFSAFFFHPE